MKDNAIKEYRRRRAERLRLRKDEEQNENNGGAQHGNTRLPFGLCKEHGIDTAGMTPREAWEALKDGGINPTEEYNKLGKTGGKKLVKELQPQRTDYEYEEGMDRDDFTHANVEKLRKVYEEGGSRGLDSEFFKFTLNNSNKDIHETSKDDADGVIYDNVRQSDYDGWFRNADSRYKPRLVVQATKNPEMRNAMLNLAYDNYKMSTDNPLPFEEFLYTPIEVYRGGRGQKHIDDDIFSAYSFDKREAEKFAKGEKSKVTVAKVRPIDTYGSMRCVGEMEIWLPREIAPNGEFDSADAKISKYRKRRADRLKLRRDADEEEVKNEPPKAKHGNTRLPYGLCNREGIDTTGMTPKEAWQALEDGTGITAGEVYEKVKKDKTVKNVTKKEKEAPKEACQEIKLEHMQQSLLRPNMKKTTKMFLEMFNKNNKEARISKLIGLSRGGAQVPTKVICASSGGKISWKSSYYSRTPTECTFKVTKMTDANKEGSACTYIHEFTHYLDFIAREEGKNMMYSSGDEALKDAINTEARINIENIPESASKSLIKIREKYKEVADEVDRWEEAEYQKLVKEETEANGGVKPDWIGDDYRINWSVQVDWNSEAGERRDRYISKRSVIRAEKFTMLEQKERNTLVPNYEDMIDAMTRGNAQRKGTVKYGHGTRYYSSSNSINHELVANYVTLSAFNPELLKEFEKAYPKTAQALSNVVDTLISRLEQSK